MNSIRPMNLILCGILLSSIAYAQKPRLTSGASGFGVDSPYTRLWNETWVLHFGGKITGINVGAPYNQSGNTVQIIVLSPNGGSSFVELGPQWYVEQQTTKLHLGDKVRIIGSKIMRDHRGSIMAGKIVVNGTSSLDLRDAHGAPLWQASTNAVAKVKLQVTDPIYANTQGVDRVVRVRGGAFGAEFSMNMKSVSVDGFVHNFEIDKDDVTMIMQVNGELRKVYLGPEWVVAQQEVPIMPGDRITATILAPNNLNALAYAESIVTAHGTLRFRNDAGQALWSR